GSPAPPRVRLRCLMCTGSQPIQPVLPVRGARQSLEAREHGGMADAEARQIPQQIRPKRRVDVNAIELSVPLRNRLGRWPVYGEYCPRPRDPRSQGPGPVKSYAREGERIGVRLGDGQVRHENP